jgi:hypothetical protein
MTKGGFKWAPVKKKNKNEGDREFFAVEEVETESGQWTTV